jgi:hypothetical protein
MTGGMVVTDLVPAADRKSAVFTGHQIGEGYIRLTLGNLYAGHSGDIIVVAAAGGGGGGGGGGGFGTPGTAGVTNLSSYVDTHGVFNQNINAWSDDTNTVLSIPSGTTALTAGGAPITQISFVHTTTLPTFQTAAGMIDVAYDITPNGITFNPAVTLKFIYYNLPAGMDPGSLQISYYDTTLNAWVVVPSTIDTTTNSISAQISHFTVYAVTYGVKPITSAPTTTTTTAAMPTTTIPVFTTTTTIAPTTTTTTSTPVETTLPITQSTLTPLVSTTAPIMTAVTTTTTSISTIPMSTGFTGTTPGSANSTPDHSGWVWVALGVVALGGIITIVLVLLRKKDNI